MRKRTYNLNLSASYVPTWTAWEVAREMACNAIDADPDGMAIDIEGTDVLKITTATVPDLGQLFVVGEGTKRPGGDTIGQFGEGAKMAALAATRLRPTGHGLVMRTPDSTVSFAFKKVLGIETLHAIVVPEDNGDGFSVTIDLPGAAVAYRGKVVPSLEEGPFDIAQPDAMRVYIKGVYIAHLKGVALWDWNLNSLETNRDRAMVSEWQTKWAIGQWLAEHMTEQQAAKIIQHGDSLEAKALEYHHDTEHARETLLAAFETIHGEGTVLAVGGEVDTMAARKGHQVAYIQNAELRTALQGVGVQTTQNVTKKQYDLEAVPITPEYAEKITRLRTLDKIVKAPGLRVQVFAVRNDSLRGWADFEDDMVLWLSEGLFSDGNDLELARTYCHELGHFLTEAYDGSVDFEAGLDGLAGRLAMHVLGGSL